MEISRLEEEMEQEDSKTDANKLRKEVYMEQENSESDGKK